MKSVLKNSLKRVLPAKHHGCPGAWLTPEDEPQIAEICFGSLNRTSPIDRNSGWERGQPIDRYYIEKFLDKYREDIKGRVLELEDDAYTVKFGGARVKAKEVLHLDPNNSKATIIDDLTKGEKMSADSFDCVILTQALHLMYDVKAAIRTVHRILKPQGTVLVTLPGISPICYEEGTTWQDHWRFTTASARRLFKEAFGEGNVNVETYGNVLTATAFLYALAQEDLSEQDFMDNDPRYQVIIGVRAAKAGGKA